MPLRQCATRCYIPNFADTTNKQIMSRTRHRMQSGDVTALQVVFPNFYVDGGFNGASFREFGLTQPATIMASIEYPAGTFTQLTFGGSASGTIANGGVLASDSVAVSIPRGAFFFIRSYFTNPIGVQNSVSLLDPSGEAVTIGVSGVADQTMSGTIAQSAISAPYTAAVWAYYPVAIVGQTARKAVMLVGDSRMIGIYDSTTTPQYYGNGGYIAQSIGGLFAYANYACSADTAQNFVNDHTVNSSNHRVALQQYFDAVIGGFGVNDLSAGRTASQIFLDVSAMAGYYSVPFLQTTIAPATLSSDGWTSLTGQTVFGGEADRVNFNMAVRRGILPVYDYVDTAAALESGTTGKWPPGFTTDGAHENFNGSLAVVRSGIVSDKLMQALA